MSAFLNDKDTPVICVPLTARTSDELRAQVAKVIESEPDMIEWRADFFQNLADRHEVIQMIEWIKQETDIPLLFTIRSVHEGGEAIALSEVEKVDLIQAVCRSSPVDLIDYEVENKPEYVESISQSAQAHKVELILSYHHFQKTPANDDLLKIGEKMSAFGASIAKISVMPQSEDDVHRLLEVTRQLDRHLSIPVITMSMGKLGVLSRVIGWVYGSKLTFAVVVDSSAPGQVPIGQLRQAIGAISEMMELT